MVCSFRYQVDSKRRRLTYCAREESRGSICDARRGGKRRRASRRHERKEKVSLPPQIVRRRSEQDASRKLGRGLVAAMLRVVPMTTVTGALKRPAAKPVLT
jgi:hypothetical protein